MAMAAHPGRMSAISASLPGRPRERLRRELGAPQAANEVAKDYATGWIPRGGIGMKASALTCG